MLEAAAWRPAVAAGLLAQVLSLALAVTGEAAPAQQLLWLHAMCIFPHICSQCAYIRIKRTPCQFPPSSWPSAGQRAAYCSAWRQQPAWRAPCTGAIPKRVFPCAMHR